MEQYLTPMGPTKLHVNPIFEISPLEPRFSEWLVFEGLSIDENGRQHFLDASVAYKRAVLNCIHYLSRFGYTKQQVPHLHLCAAASSCTLHILVTLLYIHTRMRTHTRMHARTHAHVHIYTLCMRCRYHMLYYMLCNLLYQ